MKYLEDISKEYESTQLTKSFRREKQRVENALWRDHGNEDIHHFYILLDRLFEKSIGRPYKKVYGEFCAKWPAIIYGDVNTRKAFRAKCYPPRSSFFSNEYIVDSNGIIKRNPNYAWIHPKEKYKTIDSEGGKNYWIFNKKLFDYPEISDYIFKIIGEKTVNAIKKETYIPSDILSKLKNKDKDEWHTWNRELSRFHDFRKCGKWIYKEVTVGEKPIRIKRGTKAFKQYYIESKKKTDALLRVNKIEKEKRLSNLLHDIENKKKAKERAQDIIDRDRLGFDENSFKGEFYHGEKRKKKD